VKPGGPFTLRRVDLDAFAELSRGREVRVCQTPQWQQFLRTSQQAEPVLAEVLREGQRVGFFTGAIVRKAGLPILGSPLRGWTTSYMGFNVETGNEVDDLLAPLKDFAFQALRCVHVELLDRQVEAIPRGWQWRDLQI